ncbi:hypothetical protein GCM10010320_35680 [Streptomyces caelestis]|nr:hypothetical protein GCM10010320_35680 [Streptomyces caelestis]
MRAGADEAAAVGDEVLVADRAAREPRLQGLPGAGRVAGDDPEMCRVMPWCGIVRQGWSAGAGCGYQTSPA